MHTIIIVVIVFSIKPCVIGIRQGCAKQNAVAGTILLVARPDLEDLRLRGCNLASKYDCPHKDECMESTGSGTFHRPNAVIEHMIQSSKHAAVKRWQTCNIVCMAFVVTKDGQAGLQPSSFYNKSTPGSYYTDNGKQLDLRPNRKKRPLAEADAPAQKASERLRSRPIAPPPAYEPIGNFRSRKPRKPKKPAADTPTPAMPVLDLKAITVGLKDAVAEAMQAGMAQAQSQATAQGDSSTALVEAVAAAIKQNLPQVQPQASAREVSAAVAKDLAPILTSQSASGEGLFIKYLKERDAEQQRNLLERDAAQGAREIEREARQTKQLIQLLNAQAENHQRLFAIQLQAPASKGHQLLDNQDSTGTGGPASFFPG